MSRAVHQLIDDPLVFEDAYAVRIVSPSTPAELRSALEGSAGLRASIAMRSRYAEDRLAEAVARGVRQYVLLGAGLDTFLLRNPHRSRGLRVFEVDHPATQVDKRERLARARLKLPPGARLVGVDFETQSLAKELARAGFRFDRPAFYSMLGVVIYVPHEAVMDTLRIVARGARGTEIVFSYSEPEHRLTEDQQKGRRRSMERMAAAGEPWITFYEPDYIASELRSAGLRVIEDLDPAQANQRYFAGRGDNLRISNGRMMHARV